VCGGVFVCVGGCAWVFVLGGLCVWGCVGCVCGGFLYVERGLFGVCVLLCGCVCVCGVLCVCVCWDVWGSLCLGFVWGVCV